MNDDEYERRRRALEEMYQADLLMVRAAHETRLRCLEALRQTEAPTGGQGSRPAPPPPPAPAPPKRTRPQNPDLRDSIEEALPGLPEQFTKEDVIRALGFTPTRSSIQRVLLHDFKERVRVEVRSEGRHPTIYRKL